ncbi:uncharacterized protein AMSG_10385 [Thecamonas trahens ATCC 50062]|uniref:Uncharacterized protein n=1 Tax=Thecamonas trahens ATCC 50062 TaxID=461836 RepID=A0A0L0DQG1_THETB|nr:hypothetical protein AMSG_10385 [Thecamonas trahens ATCC 50062]KNC54537.1 hypothetical protein AMSG_10385 [Thecamonas trahens ATCC 50062]|eukprot:XP_013753553.1 hypothetical protein AMSG_10385 [Thecamonas trahens ATCC 50062]
MFEEGTREASLAACGRVLASVVSPAAVVSAAAVVARPEPSPLVGLLAAALPHALTLAGLESLAPSLTSLVAAAAAAAARGIDACQDSTAHGLRIVPPRLSTSQTMLVHAALDDLHHSENASVDHLADAGFVAATATALARALARHATLDLLTLRYSLAAAVWDAYQAGADDAGLASALAAAGLYISHVEPGQLALVAALDEVALGASDHRDPPGAAVVLGAVLDAIHGGGGLATLPTPVVDAAFAQVDADALSLGSAQLAAVLPPAAMRPLAAKLLSADRYHTLPHPQVEAALLGRPDGGLGAFDPDSPEWGDALATWCEALAAAAEIMGLNVAAAAMRATASDASLDDLCTGRIVDVVLPLLFDAAHGSDALSAFVTLALDPATERGALVDALANALATLPHAVTRPGLATLDIVRSFADDVYAGSYFFAFFATEPSDRAAEDLRLLLTTTDLDRSEALASGVASLNSLLVRADIRSKLDELCSSTYESVLVPALVASVEAATAAEPDKLALLARRALSETTTLRRWAIAFIEVGGCGSPHQAMVQAALCAAVRGALLAVPEAHHASLVEASVSAGSSVFAGLVDGLLAALDEVPSEDVLASMVENMFDVFAPRWLATSLDDTTRAELLVDYVADAVEARAELLAAAEAGEMSELLAGLAHAFPWLPSMSELFHEMQARLADDFVGGLCAKALAEAVTAGCDDGQRLARAVANAVLEPVVSPVAYSLTTAIFPVLNRVGGLDAAQADALATVRTSLGVTLKALLATKIDDGMLAREIVIPLAAQCSPIAGAWTEVPADACRGIGAAAVASVGAAVGAAPDAVAAGVCALANEALTGDEVTGEVCGALAGQTVQATGDGIKVARALVSSVLGELLPLALGGQASSSGGRRLREMVAQVVRGWLVEAARAAPAAVAAASVRSMAARCRALNESDGADVVSAVGVAVTQRLAGLVASESGRGSMLAQLVAAVGSRLPEDAMRRVAKAVAAATDAASAVAGAVECVMGAAPGAVAAAATEMCDELLAALVESEVSRVGPAAVDAVVAEASIAPAVVGALVSTMRAWAQGASNVLAAVCEGRVSELEPVAEVLALSQRSVLSLPGLLETELSGATERDLSPLAFGMVLPAAETIVGGVLQLFSSLHVSSSPLLQWLSGSRASGVVAAMVASAVPSRDAAEAFFRPWLELLFPASAAILLAGVTDGLMRSEERMASVAAECRSAAVGVVSSVLQALQSGSEAVDENRLDESVRTLVATAKAEAAAAKAIKAVDNENAVASRVRAESRQGMPRTGTPNRATVTTPLPPPIRGVSETYVAFREASHPAAMEELFSGDTVVDVVSFTGITTGRKLTWQRTLGLALQSEGVAGGRASRFRLRVTNVSMRKVRVAVTLEGLGGVQAVYDQDRELAAGLSIGIELRVWPEEIGEWFGWVHVCGFDVYGKRGVVSVPMYVSVRPS